MREEMLNTRYSTGRQTKIESEYRGKSEGAARKATVEDDLDIERKVQQLEQKIMRANQKREKKLQDILAKQNEIQDQIQRTLLQKEQ
jgi:hypothetical protein